MKLGKSNGMEQIPIKNKRCRNSSKIWRLRYIFYGEEIISKWREDSPPANELELELKMKATPIYYNGGQ